MAICDFRPDATNIPNTCMSKTNMEGERKCLGTKENNVFNQPDGLSLYREVKNTKVRVANLLHAISLAKYI